MEEQNRQDIFIARDTYLQKLIESKHNRLVKIICGIRRCGKSFLLFEIFKKHLLDQGVKPSHIIAVSLDTLGQERLCDPQQYMQYITAHTKEAGMYYLFIDEVQLMDKFVKVLNELLRNPNFDIYVTGSNSRFLSSDIVTEFRGRGDVIQLYPLSFAEFYAYQQGDRLQALQDYGRYGGLPPILSFKSPERKREYLTNLFHVTYLRDVVERHHIQHEAELAELITVIASGVGSLTNPTRLADTFKGKKGVRLTAPTIAKYLAYFEDSFILHKALRFDVKGRKYINGPLKYYFSDVGLRNARIGFRQKDPPHIMENIIYLELRRRGYQVDVGVVGVFEKGKKGRYQKKDTEVDFVAQKGDEKIYIQSCYNLHDEEKEKQEKRSLLAINDVFKRVLIVNDTFFDKAYDEDGCLVMGLLEFLLNPHSLGEK